MERQLADVRFDGLKKNSVFRGLLQQASTDRLIIFFNFRPDVLSDATDSEFQKSGSGSTLWRHLIMTIGR